MELEDLRLKIYRAFASTGRPPVLEDSNEIREGLAELARQRHLAVSAGGEILMAHPFSSVPLGFAVMGRSTLWWGGCAWDSFALPHLIPNEPEVLVSTTCPNCHQALAWNVNNQEPPAGKEVAHFLVPAAKMWDDVVHTCGNQRIFCDEQCIDSWLDQNGHHKGYVMPLSTLWNLASGWYAGRLDEGYQRREPSLAKDYLRGAGLSGAFWGLED